MFVRTLIFFILLGSLSVSGFVVAATLTELDINQNGKIDIFDFSHSVSRLGNGRTLADLATIKSRFNDSVPTLSPTPLPPGALKTKKWHPGHYIRFDYVSPVDLKAWFDDHDRPEFKGARIRLGWKYFEPDKDNYQVNKLEEYFDSLPPNKHLIVTFDERENKSNVWCDLANAPTGETGNRKQNNIPNYIADDPVFPAQETTNQAKTSHVGCVAQWWQDPIRLRMELVLKEIARVYDNDPRLEAINFGETSFGIPENYANQAALHQDTLPALKRIHTNIADAFQKTHVVQNMNYLTSGGGQCAGPMDLANHIAALGHGIGNPDSVPWESLPWQCGDYNHPGLAANDTSKPIYYVYSQFKGKAPLFVGNDGSQLECPIETPRTFSGDVMNFENLVKYHYLTNVPGYRYTHTPANYSVQVPGFGASHLMWNYTFWSRPALGGCTSCPGCQQQFIDAYSTYLSGPNRTTNEVCPENIRCQ